MPAPVKNKPGVVKAGYEYQANGENLTAQVFGNGHLYCTKCAIVWCKHLEGFVRRNLDANFIWHPDNKVWVVMVPYVPSVDVWASVEIFIQPNADGSHEVNLLRPDTGDYEVNLGSIFPGEGRYVIRDLLHNWFILRWADEDTGRPIPPFCKQGTHKYQQEAIFQKNIKNAQHLLAEEWSLFWYKACVACQSLAVNFNDVIPRKT